MYARHGHKLGVIMNNWVEALERRRLMDAGDLDTSFGDDGFIEFTGGEDRAVSDVDLDVDPQGGLVMAGVVTAGEGPAEVKTIEVVRTHPDGTPVAKFGDNGRLVMPVPEDQGGRSFPAVLAEPTPDGGILLQMGYRLWKLRPNGSLDKGFGHNGRAAFTDFPDGAMSFDVDAQGRIYVAGPSAAITEPARTLVLMRLNPDGSLDKTFGGGTGSVRPVSLNQAGGFRVHALPNGKIMVATTRTLLAGTAYTAVRLNNDGSLDTTYGDEGVAAGEFSGADDDRVVQGVGIGTITDSGQIFLHFTEDDQSGTTNNDTWAVNAFDPNGTFVENVIADTLAAMNAEPIVRDGELFVTNSFLEGVRFLNPNGTLNQPLTDNANAALGITGSVGIQGIALAADGSILVARNIPGAGSNNFGSGVRIGRLFRDDAPAATLLARNLAVRREASYRFTVQYRDDDGIDLTTLGDDDITVALPGGGRRKARLVGTDATGTPTVVNATYLITSPDGVWDFNDNGTYTVRIERRSVRDINANAPAQRPIGTFQALIPPDIIVFPQTVPIKPLAIAGLENLDELTATPT
jgi:uncharacterized delta-60 repeat protein